MINTFKKTLIYYQTVKGQFGIELTGHELMKLDLYLKSYVKHFKNKSIEKADGDLEGFVNYLIDNFGLNLIDLCHYDKGMRLTGKPEFKKYCQNHIQEWRDEKELI